MDINADKTGVFPVIAPINMAFCNFMYGHLHAYAFIKEINN